MAKLFRIIGISILAVVVLAGSAGISLFIHACGYGKHVDYAVYPEFFSVGESCCNPWEGTTMSACSSEDHSDRQGISKTSCCESQHLILKVQQLVQPVRSFNNQTISVQTTGIIFNLRPTEPLVSGSFEGFLAGDPSPPPPAGKSLVILLHQIRIPS